MDISISDPLLARAKAWVADGHHESVEAYVGDLIRRDRLSLHRAFDLSATFPEPGRNIGHVRRGYRRFERASHVIFYVRSDDGVLIVRVLHRRMEPRTHLRTRRRCPTVLAWYTARCFTDSRVTTSNT